MSDEPVKRRAACMSGHKFDATSKMVQLNSTGKSLKLICPICSEVATMSNSEIAKLFGLTGENAKNVVKLFADGKLTVKTDAETPVEPPEGEYEDENEDEGTDDEPSEEGDGMGNGLDQDDEIPLEEEVVRNEPPRRAGRPPLRPSARTSQPPPATRRSEVEVNEPVITADDIELSPKDVLIETVRGSGLPKDLVDLLLDNIAYRNDWDPWTAKELFEKASMSDTVSRKLAQRYQLRLEGLRNKVEHNKRLTNFVTAGVSRGNPGSPSFPFGSQGFGESVPASQPLGGQSLYPSEATDPTNAAVQAIINAAGGRITPQVLASIDAVRSAIAGGMAPQRQGASPNGGTSDLIAIMQSQQMQSMKMFETMMLSQRQQKSEEEERKKEEAMNQKFENMMGMIQQLAARPQTVAAPQLQVADVLLTLLKDKDNKKENPVQDGMFLKMFDNLLESGKGANESVAHAIAELKNELNTKIGGGGVGGLPSNPDQLKGLVDLQRLSAEIEKTKNEFANSAANREMISGIAESAFQTIGQAIASKFTTNTGTPEEKSITVNEQPIDDGSVVQIVCPKCGVTMTAPADAKAVQCPQCMSVLDRVMNAGAKDVVRVREEPLAVVPQPVPEPLAEPPVPSVVESSKSSVVSEKDWVPLSPKIQHDVPTPTEMTVTPPKEIRRILGLGATDAAVRENDLSGSTDNKQEELVGKG